MCVNAPMTAFMLNHSEIICQVEQIAMVGATKDGVKVSNEDRVKS